MAVKIALSSSRRSFAFLFVTAICTVLMLGSIQAVSAQQVDVRSENPLDLDITFSPEVSTPGDRVSLRLLIRNDGLSAALPDVTIQLPDEVAPDISSLPSGTNYNFQTGILYWQPYIEPIGGSAQIEIWLEVKAVQINNAKRDVRVLVIDSGTEMSAVSSLWIGSAPQASIVFDPAQSSIGQPVRLIANVSGTGPFTQTWHLDDGRIVDAKNPQVVFATAGSHLVNLQVSNTLGTSVATNRINIVPQPIALFSAADGTTISDAAVRFINESGGEPPLTYSWTFGDGNLSVEKNPEHIYSQPGIYEVKLVVQNVYGRSEASSYVQIGDPPNFEFIFPDYTNAGQRVAGTTKSEKTSTEFLWDMGDGRHYSGAEISHRYWTPGDYIVTVTARNEFGETRVSKWIRVGFDLAYYFMPFISSGGFVDSTLESLSLINPVDGAINIGLGEVPELNPIDFAPGATTAERLFIYINEARRLYNLRPLTYVHSLSVAAQAHTDDMAANGYTAHIGSDGSTPAYRIQQAGYRGGYGGEATAWGMSDPIEPVRFWLTSPSHRAIILNPAASEVGIGFTTNFESPNVWYWTAEFASIDLPVVNASAPQAPEPEEVLELALLGPPQASEFALNDNAQLIFSWSWAGGIQDHQRFALYLNDGGRTFQAGVIRGSQASGQYHFAANASSMAIAPGPYSWQVKLEDSAQGIVLEESPIWRVTFTNSNEGVADVSPTPIPSEPLPSPTPEAPPEQPPSQNPLLIATPVPPTAP